MGPAAVRSGPLIAPVRGLDPREVQPAREARWPRGTDGTALALQSPGRDGDDGIHRLRQSAGGPQVGRCHDRTVIGVRDFHGPALMFFAVVPILQHVREDAPPARRRIRPIGRSRPSRRPQLSHLLQRPDQAPSVASAPVASAPVDSFRRGSPRAQRGSRPECFQRRRHDGSFRRPAPGPTEARRASRPCRADRRPVTLESAYYQALVQLAERLERIVRRVGMRPGRQALITSESSPFPAAAPAAALLRAGRGPAPGSVGSVDSWWVFGHMLTLAPGSKSSPLLCS
jgi:hypothetical protein